MCNYCHREMREAESCTFSHIKIGDSIHERNTTYFGKNIRCHNCGIINKTGHYHHFGCDMERCPICGLQLISCDCLPQKGVLLTIAKREYKPEDHPVYRGLRNLDGTGGQLVTRDGVVLDPKPSQKLYNHSLDGFNWGYSGSGPAQLSLALLLDACHNPNLAIRYRQRFKFQKVAGWGERWEISRKEITDWLNDQKPWKSDEEVRP